MIVLQLDSTEAGIIEGAAARGAQDDGVLIAWDPIDRAIKVKRAGRWSPPLGKVIADD